MSKIALVAILGLVFIALDIYVFQALRVLTSGWGEGSRRAAHIAYWTFNIVVIAAMLWYNLGDRDELGRDAKNVIRLGLFVSFLMKFFASLVLLIGDLVRGVQWVISKFSSDITPQDLSRSDFLAKTTIVAGALPLVAMTYGIVKGAHDYHVRRVKLKLANLPKSFEGMKIAQISDIHSGSFFNKTAVQGGVDMLMRERPDAVFFTGDLVNSQAIEMKEYQPIFEKVKAPLGVYSILGNHDYGDYHDWPTQRAKHQNLEDLKRVQKQMGWQLLLDENKIITQGGDQLAIVGIENWGARGNFPKYGNLADAVKGTDEAAVKLLLSHDPSHWRAQVVPQFPDIDAMFAGHTHGMQFGIEIGSFKWSPVQYMYEEWAGLYKQDDQQLYVNRGYGYLGFPGRVGMPPEITVFELTRG